MKKTQSDLEKQLTQRQLQVDAEMMTLREAFGDMEEWVTEFGGRKAFLHPQHKQWLWHDTLHQEWVFAGCGVDEGILLTIGSTAGVKKIPKSGGVVNWCVWMENGELHPPLTIEDLRKKLKKNAAQAGIQIWSTQSTDWFPANSEEAKKIIFEDHSEDATILRGKS